MASAEPVYQRGPRRCWAGTGVMYSPARPLNRQFFFILIGVVWILGMLGAQTPDGNFQFYFGIEVPISKLLLTQICTIWYFAHFFIITPIVSTMEKPLPVPESIATAVLAKGSASGSAKANG
jgi:ubiquinol-cytochrome c reductase cytochrome b subunit